ncbi:MAG: NAD(P)-dependent oxidoreductase, partial [Oscillospiraceae bacterium]
PYGFSKYIMAKYSEGSNNIYDLVLFGVFGKYEEWKRRFISNNICNNLAGRPMTIEKNMYFDYIDVEDLAQIMKYFIEHNPLQKRYNICRGEKIDLLSIAKTINKVMATNTDILVAKSGLKLEYTGNNDLFLKETGWETFIPFEKSIENLVCFYKNSTL